ncbi:MAG: Rab family GTPase [Promethearchaeati archaeon SRVP18_Atabeyarchaeia-1]
MIRDTSERRTYKLIVIGDPGVGKTSLIRAQAGMLFRPEYIATIGADVITRIYGFRNQTIFLLIFDIAGQSLYDSVNDYFFSGASSALIVFDLTRRDTFDHIRDWSGEVRKRIPYPIPILLLGNKADLEQERKVSARDAREVAVASGVHDYLETSARTAANVDKAFLGLVARCIVEAPKDSRLADKMDEVLADIHATDQELVSEIRKLDDVGRQGLGEKRKP